MTCVREIFGSHLHVSALDHDIMCVKLSMMSGISVRGKDKTTLDDDSKYLRGLVYINQKMLTLRNRNGLAFLGRNVEAPSLGLRPEGNISKN